MACYRNQFFWCKISEKPNKIIGPKIIKLHKIGFQNIDIEAIISKVDIAKAINASLTFMVLNIFNDVFIL